MFRQSLRSLRRSPGFSLSVVLILALGIGVNTAAFSAIYTLLLEPLPYPYPDPHRLVDLFETTVDRKPRGVAEANLIDWRARSGAFEAMSVYQPRTFGLTLGERDAVTVVQTGMVMADFFPALGVPPAIGRFFSESEEIAGAPLLVITDRLWRRMFAADPAVIGRRVALNEEPYTIIGVMPPGFEFPMGAALPDLFLALSRKDYCCGRLGQQAAVGRLRPGVTLDHARAELESAAAALAREHPESNGGRSAGLRPLQAAMTGPRREPLFLLAAAAALLLVIACANVAGLLLARALGRSREFAIRAALGAGLWQIARQFFVESAALAFGGAALGLTAARVVLRAVPRFVPAHTALDLNRTALGVALALAVAVALALGAAPASLVRRRPHGRFRALLVVAQVALSVVLLLASSVLLRSFLRLLAVHPGFRTEHVLRFGIGLPEKRYDTERKLIAFHRDLEGKLAALPGVASAGVAGRLPLRGGSAGSGGAFQIVGANIPVPQRPRAWVNTASPGYFETMGIPLIEGRLFSWQYDRPAGQRVAIVNRAFARAYLRDRPALGAVLEVRWVTELNPDGSAWQIVGVVGDTRQATLDREPIPEIFLSSTQVGMDGAAYVIRARRDDPALPKAVSVAVEQQDPRIQRVSPTPLALTVQASLEGRAVPMRLIGGFGALALLLTAIGIYAIVAFRVAEQSRDLAIRSALGATAPHIRRLVLAHGGRLAVAGTAAGLAAFAAAAPLLPSQLYGVRALDPLSLAAAAAGVLLVGLAASFAPSRRAARSSPMELLRQL